MKTDNEENRGIRETSKYSSKVIHSNQVSYATARSSQVSAVNFFLHDMIDFPSLAKVPVFACASFMRENGGCKLTSGGRNKGST